MIDDIWDFLNKKKDGLIKNLCLSLKHDLVKKFFKTTRLLRKIWN